MWNVFEWGWKGRWSDGRNQENPSLQTKESRVPKSDEKKLNKFWNYCIPKGKTKGLIIGMAYVGHFFVWMTMQKWYLMHLKSCITCCVISSLCFYLTKRQN